MKEFIRKNDRTVEWVIGAAAVVLPVVAWISEQADLNSLTLYDIFPPLGLIAFWIMWTHFVMGALRRYAGVDRKSHGLYLPVSMGLVLALIILHPGLFYVALYLDGLGLPPQSYMQAYASQIGFVTLGIIGLMIFLSYELKRFFGQKKWWRFVELLQIVGMIAIFIHGLGLGREIRDGWFGAIWITYGISLLAAVIYVRFVYKKKETKNHASKS